MANDPTTTGNGQPAPEPERQTASVTVPVGLIRETHPFKIEISGELIYEVDLRRGVLVVSVKSNGHEDWVAKIGLGLLTGERLVRFLAQLKQDFLSHLVTALAHEAIAHAGDVAAFLSSDMKIVAAGRDEIVGTHLRRTRHRLEHLLSDLPAKTTGAWTKIKLEGVMRVAMFALAMRGEEIKAETVAAEMRRMDAATGPASGGALKKQVSRFSINWRKLRRDIEGIAAAERKGDIAGGENVTKKDRR